MKQLTEVSWFREHLDPSLAFIDQAGLGPEARERSVAAAQQQFVSCACHLR